MGRGTGTPVRPDEGVEGRQGVSSGPRRRARPRLVWVAIGVGVAVLGILVLLGAQRLITSFRNPFGGRTVDRSQPAVLKALEDLREYHAASGHFQVIIDLEKDVRYVPSFIKGERTLFVAVGSVDAEVDFSRIGSDAVTVSEDRRSVSIALPHAGLSPARIDAGKSYVYDRDRGLVDRLGSVFSDNPTSERELYVLAEKKLSDAAAEGGITARAETNTKQMLTSLLESLGFTSVAVTFG